MFLNMNKDISVTTEVEQSTQHFIGNTEQEKHNKQTRTLKKSL